MDGNHADVRQRGHVERAFQHLGWGAAGRMGTHEWIYITLRCMPSQITVLGFSKNHCNGSYIYNFISPFIY
ncbi:SKU5 similar 13, partial [Zea mays]